MVPVVAMVWVAVAAVLADLAIRLPAGSLAAALLVLSLVGLLLSCGRGFAAPRLPAPDGSSTPPGPPVPADPAHPGDGGAGAVGLDRVGLGLLVALALAVVLRASPWVTSIVTSAVLALTTLVAADGLRTDRGPTWLRSFRQSIRSLIQLPRWLRTGLDHLPRIAPGRAGPLIRAAVVAFVVALILGALLASGDAVFRALVSSLSPGSAFGHGVVVLVCAVPLAALALLALRTDNQRPRNPLAAAGADPPAGSGDSARFRVESLTARWAVAGVLGVWCGVQVVVVSGGARAVLADQGLTAAEYARQGFFQLVAVAAVSLLVLNWTQRLLGSRAGRGSRVPALAIGATLGVLIVVTFSRLSYYIGSFGLTMLRLAVATFLVWLALMTALSVARALGVGAGRCWLQSAAVLSAAALAVVYAAANPAAVVAGVNLDRADTLDELDVDYLLRLGPDARGPLARFDWDRLGGRPAEVTAVLCRPADGGRDPGWGVLGWNRARAQGPVTAC